MGRTCAVRLLGGFQVEVDGRPIQAQAWRHRRGADLVKLLALAPEHRLHREELMERLWPELGGEAAAANLRKAVHFARRALGRQDSIESIGELVALWPAGDLRVDAESAETQARKALAGSVGLEAAADLFSGDLLPADRYADWTEPHRERLRRRRLEVLRAAARWEEVLQVDGTDEIEVAYRFRRDRWGQGFATEAAGAMVNRGFTELNLVRILAFIDPKVLTAERDMLKRNDFRMEYIPFDWSLNDLTGRGGN